MAPTAPAGQRVLVVGDVIDDVLVRPLGPVTTDSDTRAEIVRRAGGSAANIACWLGSVGADVAFVGRVGAADVARHRAELATFGVDARLVADPTAATGTIVIVVDERGGRTMLTDRGANLRLEAADVPGELLGSSRLLHLTGYGFVEPGVRRAATTLLDQARRAGVGVSVDPSSAAFLAEVGPEAFLLWTRGVDLCFPNRDEARVLSGSAEPVVAAERLSAHYGTVAVTCEGDGAVVAQRGRPTVRLEADRVAAVDTTGAGDAFCAGFLHHWLGEPDAVAAARSGTRLARTAVVRLGGRPPVAEVTAAASPAPGPTAVT